MLSRFDLVETPLSGLRVILRKPHEDSRGSFARLFCANELGQLGTNYPIVQINHSVTRDRASVRGLHFQYAPHAETKIVCCLSGEIFDVAVDLRPQSPTFLHWHAEILSAHNRKSLCIPRGFAHGFQTLVEDCQLLYLHDGYYDRTAEGGLNVADPRIGIVWPLPIAHLSARDHGFPLITAEFEGLMP